MEKVSKFKSRREWESFLWIAFVEQLVSAKSKTSLRNKLEKVLSEAEKQIILKRITAVMLIREGKSYKEIGELLWISPSTISSIKKNFWTNSAGYKSRRQIEKMEGRPVKKTRGSYINYALLNKKSDKEPPISGIWDLIKYLDKNWPPSAYSNAKERWRFLSEQ